VVPEISLRTDRQTDTLTDVLITILRNRPAVEVIQRLTGIQHFQPGPLCDYWYTRILMRSPNWQQSPWQCTIYKIQIRCPDRGVNNPKATQRGGGRTGMVRMLIGYTMRCCTFAPPAEYDVRRRCGLVSNYFDHLFEIAPATSRNVELVANNLFGLVNRKIVLSSVLLHAAV